MTLEGFFEQHPNVAIAFSGGVDSAYLLYCAVKYAKSVKAYYINTAFQPQFELDDARKLAEELGANIKVIELDILTNKEVTDNPSNRCYFCKRKIFNAIIENARKDGYDIILDGTNASDDVADRPGMKALEELSVYSPLRICGLTKTRIRELSKEAGLFTHAKPAYACLATRIPCGQAITRELLIRTEEAEDYLFSLGFSNFRVRCVNNDAKIQIEASQIPLLMDNREKILECLSKRYSSVCLDLEVRK